MNKKSPQAPTPISAPLSIADIPPTLPVELHPPTPRHITAESPTSEHDDYDASQLLHMATMINLAWVHARDIDDIAKCTRATIQLSQHRRKCFQKEYGITNSKSSLPDVVLPID